MSDKQTSQTTTDHEKIRQWAQKRDAKPVSVAGTGGQDDVGLLRLNFPGYDEESLKPISWEVFFKQFEANNLAFLYQEETADGEQSNFFKLISRDQ